MDLMDMSHPWRSVQQWHLVEIHPWYGSPSVGLDSAVCAGDSAVRVGSVTALNRGTPTGRSSGACLEPCLAKGEGLPCSPPTLAHRASPWAILVASVAHTLWSVATPVWHPL